MAVREDCPTQRSKGTIIECLALSVGVMIFLLLSGVLIFNRVEKTFIDTV